jgi:drug/metabolite transporter (DMT)-like permease
MLWVPITLAAATFQVLRTSRQHELRAVLSTNAAGFVRYAYGAPLAGALAAVAFGVFSRPLPSVPLRFWGIVTLAGTAQIVGTVALLSAFKLRDFAVGTVYAKAEVLMVAAVGALGLGEPLRWPGWVGAGIVTAGVAALASRGSLGALLRRAGDRAALAGMLAGALFAVAAVGIRGASRSLGDAPPFDRALVTLTAMLAVQAVLNGLYLVVTAPGEIARTARAWRPAVPVGMLSLGGSIGWAWAVTLENAAKVRTLGQVELLIAFAIGHRRLGEHHDRWEYVASGVVLAGVVVVGLLG